MVDFSKVASQYRKNLSIQKSAGEVLLGLLKIGGNDDVLDLGCGAGNLTEKIRERTTGKVVGIDISEGMIREATKRGERSDIIFELKAAEDLDYKDCFDVVYCNSTFHWFRNPQKAIRNCYVALRKGGKIGMQSPAKKIFSPNFVEAVEEVRKDTRTKEAFAHFKEPWLFLENEDGYRDLLEKCKFKVVLSKIRSMRTRHTIEEVFNIFSTAAAVAYLNQDFYDCKITRKYKESFREIMKGALSKQANNGGEIALVFNRVFLIAVKE